jgi:predicted metal-dependent HD superfamily phosphohydrolase
MSDTKRLWERFARRIGIPDSEIDASFRALAEKYSLPRRDYHSLCGHVRRCVELFDCVRHLAIDPIAVEASLWTHDAHHDPNASDNEEQSSLWMRCFFERFGVRDKALLDRIADLIAATVHAEAPIGNDCALVADIDLSILGTSRKEFDRYEADIRNEYAHVPWAAFAEKRANILQTFLARPTIYHHPAFVVKYERRARKNLSRSIQKLRQSQ